MTEKYFPIPVNWIKVLLLMVITVSGMIVMNIVEFNNLVVGILTKAFFIAGLGLVCLLIIVGFSSFNRNMLRFKNYLLNRFNCRGMMR
jgi:hypothetical protein